MRICSTSPSFCFYSNRFGGSDTQGDRITLTQSDKWLRQAGVFDAWNITTIDTALAFRKISRGAIYLDFPGWRDFLEEFVIKTRQEMDQVMEKLERCGRPSHSHTTRYCMI